MLFGAASGCWHFLETTRRHFKNNEKRAPFRLTRRPFGTELAPTAFRETWSKKSTKVAVRPNDCPLRPTILPLKVEQPTHVKPADDDIHCSNIYFLKKM